MKILKRHENAICRYTLYESDTGKEMWHCLFKYDSHPVNKLIFRMSGAEPIEEEAFTQE